MISPVKNLKVAETLAWVAAALLLGWWIVSAVDARHYQQAAASRLAAERLGAQPIPGVSEVTAVDVPISVPPAEAITTGATIGRLEVPRLGLSVMVAEGDDDHTLDVAVGHLPDTPFPWQPGNSALAAHRDSYFRPLKAIRADDDLRLTTAQGTFTYKVKQVSIVRPDDLSVLRDTTVPTLTLITCYPFSYVGHAPKRFIVRAERTS
jgi:sortase A